MNPTSLSTPTTRRARGLQLALAFCPLLFASACATHGTLMVSRPSPALAINLAAAPQSPADASLVSIIRPAGRGSWKRDAAWDEFSVRLVNRSSVPLQIEAAHLVASTGGSLVPGRDPWDLEKQSRSWWQNTTSSTASQAAAYAVGAFVLGPGMLLGPVVAAPAYSAGFIGIQRAKAKITAEFQRRRLALPLSLAPGATVSGSLFFRISPQPKALLLRGTHAEGPFELTFDLAGLTDPRSTAQVIRSPAANRQN
jgi:hypothetical protein